MGRRDDDLHKCDQGVLSDEVPIGKSNSGKLLRGTLLHPILSFTCRFLTDVLRDSGYAVRLCGRTPLFFAGSAIVLTLGIGANCAIFNLVYSVLLKPMPYERPEEVVMVSQGLKRPDGSYRPGMTTGKTIQFWRDRSPGVFLDMAVIKMWDGNLDAQFDLVLPDHAERLRAGLVTPNFFSVLGAQAALGRTFSIADETDGQYYPVVLSHGLWQRLFGSDPGVVGRSLTFIVGKGKERRPRPFTVVGVLMPNFRFTYPFETELWAINPWKALARAHPNWLDFNGAVGRLAPGISVAAANARMAEPQREGHSAYVSSVVTVVEPISVWVVGQTRPSILLVSAVALLLLLIACATVANGSLVRMAQRKRELAVRASLGAGRGRLIRQLLVEGMVLSLAGTAGGVFLAALLIPSFRSLVPNALPRADEMKTQAALLLLPAAVATLAAMLALLVPVIQGSRLDLAQALKTSPGSRSGKRWRFAFVALQTTVQTSLLIGAALLLISFWTLHRVDLGFNGKQVVTAEMRLLGPKYLDPRTLVQFQQNVIEQVRALPGVIDAGITSAVPLRGVDWLRTAKRIGFDKEYLANLREVDPGYFSVMQLPLLRGRQLTDQDTASSPPVMVVSESFARRVFPGEDPIGKQVDLERRATIVGVVKDIHYEALDRAPSPAMYVPKAQNPSELICLVLRTSGHRAGLIEGVLRHTIHGIDPTVPVMGVTTVDQIVSDSVADRRFYTTTTVAFAVLALLLTVSGLIIVIARSVTERRRELAIRAALGAQHRELVKLVMCEGLIPVFIGTTFGLLGAWFGGRILEHFLFGVTLHAPVVYVGTGVFTILIASLACFTPARGISKLPPAIALQTE